MTAAPALATDSALLIRETPGTSYLRSPDTRDAAARRLKASTDLRSPDTRDAAEREPAAARVDLRSPDTRDAGEQAALGRGPVALSPGAESSPAAVDAFGWWEFGLGSVAATMFIALLAAGGLTARARSRQSTRPAAK